ncbi:WDR78 protein, partial [Nyctiprogne leucopyga]|nr:WDR78 protein [Nyctiprogne leucopyga]
LQVFDNEGKNVTPHPLFHSVPNTVGARQGKLLAPSPCSGAIGSVCLSPFSTHQTSGLNASLDSVLRKGLVLLTPCDFSDVQVRQEEIKELTKEELDRTVDIYLTETETIRILDVPSVAVSVESEDASRVLERNKIYVDMCKNRPGNDHFVAKMMQTINGAAKNKEVQCDKIIMEDKGVTATSWDLYNSFNVSETESTSKAGGSRATTGNSSKSHTTKEHHQTMSVSSDRGSTTTSTMISESAALGRIHQEEECHSEAVLTSANLQQDLFFMERILMENIFQPKLAAYRQLPVLIDLHVTTDTSSTVASVKEAQQEEHDKEEKDEEELKEALSDLLFMSDLNKTPEETVPPSLEQLWSYVCDLTHGHSVSSMAWSKVNPDLLAVGYGAFDFKDQKKGLACCWSLKNPMVTSSQFVFLVFVCFFNAFFFLLYYFCFIYLPLPVSKSKTSPVSESSNKHRGPVWQLRWVEQDRGATGDGKKERLICISADGRVTEWFIQKRLDCTDLMKIKQTESEKKKLPSEKERRSKTLILQHAAGMCFDFHPKDTNLYLAGTEEGHIHKCSCSCNEQVLQTYRGHKGPVYKVAWNPFSTDTFLSCSADWSIILWHQGSQTPVLTFSSAAASVHDIMWSPKSAFVFAAANEGRAEIWDLSVSILNPVISCSADPGVKFTSVLFARNTDCLLVGDSKGGVSVFELQNLAAPNSTEV